VPVKLEEKEMANYLPFLPFGPRFPAFPLPLLAIFIS